MGIVSAARRVAVRLGWIRDVDEAAARRLRERHEADRERAERDPFRFVDEYAFRHYRRSRGLRTPRLRDVPRDPDRDPYEVLRRRP